MRKGPSRIKTIFPFGRSTYSRSPRVIFTFPGAARPLRSAGSPDHHRARGWRHEDIHRGLRIARFRRATPTSTIPPPNGVAHRTAATTAPRKANPGHTRLASGQNPPAGRFPTSRLLGQAASRQVGTDAHSCPTGPAAHCPGFVPRTPGPIALTLAIHTITFEATPQPDSVSGWGWLYD